jgi:biopolymer transport protein ExbB/TolQ
MAGIGHALVSTAIGLAVAIPAVIGFNLFQKKVSLILNNIDVARDLCLAFTKTQKREA